MKPTDFILPLAGIILVVTLVWLAGGRRNIRLDRTTVDQALRAEGYAPVTITVADDGRAAMAWLEDRSALAVVRAMGDHAAITVPGPDDIRGIAIDGDPPRLQVRFRSYGQPPFAITLTDPETLDRWRKVLMLYGEMAARKESTS
ncbi:MULTISPECIES: hypothetical protein [unclassified Minwuia]|uniref:hypothetical protein n=1 Tax=unclassified Minwuia TaxID=2618799 RepID=UPI002479BB81|nr:MULTISPECIES: hypothetical protein [unclassified Minwuia]